MLVILVASFAPFIEGALGAHMSSSMDLGAPIASFIVGGVLATLPFGWIYGKWVPRIPKGQNLTAPGLSKLRRGREGPEECGSDLRVVARRYREEKGN
jgi:hypothetical protein